MLHGLQRPQCCRLVRGQGSAPSSRQLAGEEGAKLEHVVRMFASNELKLRQIRASFNIAPFYFFISLLRSPNARSPVNLNNLFFSLFR